MIGSQVEPDSEGKSKMENRGTSAAYAALLVPRARLELARQYDPSQDIKSCAPTNFATGAWSLERRYARKAPRHFSISLSAVVLSISLFHEEGEFARCAIGESAIGAACALVFLWCGADHQ